MAEDSVRVTGLSSGLAVLLSDDKPKGEPQKSHLVSYCDDIGSWSLERTLEHIFDLPHWSVRPSSSLIDVDFIRSILRKQTPKFQIERDLGFGNDGLYIVDRGCSPGSVILDDSSMCGNLNVVRKPLLVESHSVFSSARANACVWKGKWMYEVTLETCGVQQLGWATISCPFTDRKGVGDAEDSYAIDGKRVSKWNKESKPYGQSWVVGDVIGCCIDLDSNVISFFRNGVSLGVAFDNIRKMRPRVGYYPAISLSEGERCELNFGACPFRYPIDGYLPIQAPPSSRHYANYLLRCLSRLLEVRCLDKPDSSYFEKLRRLKRFAPLKDLFYPISDGIMLEFFNIIHSEEGSLEYVARGTLPSFFLDVFGVQEPHDYAVLDQVLDLFVDFPGSEALLQHLIAALSCSCKVASLVLTDCPYTGPYPYLALACHILRREAMMILWWKSPDFDFSFEGFLTRKSPNMQDLHSLIPSVWWPGSCEDVGSESSMMLTMTALSGAINKIEEMHRELCRLVIRFVPPVLPVQPPGAVFKVFLRTFILKVRGGEQKISSSVSTNSALVSLYTAILHFLSEGFPTEGISGMKDGSGKNVGADGGFLHRGGKRCFPVHMFFKDESNCAGVPRIGGPASNLFSSRDVNDEETKQVQWDEGCMDDVETRVTHSTKLKPCCCSSSDVGSAQTSRYSIRYASGSSKGSCTLIKDRSAHVAAECSSRGLSDDIMDKPSTSDQSRNDVGYQSLQLVESMQTFNESSSVILQEEELLDIMLLLYHLGVAPKFRQAFYYMSHQSQSMSLLDDTDKQIRERSCTEEVKRLKEVRNMYREELVDYVRHCAWYRISLFSHWKQRGMYATCMWVVELLLVLSNTDSIFYYVPEYYLESLVDSFHALRKSDPPFVSSSIFIKQGLASFVTFVVKHFNDSRISSADIKDLLLHSISALVQCKDYLTAFESNKEAIQRMPRALLLAFDNRSWIPVTNILLRLCRGFGFGSSKHAESSSSSVLFQVLLRDTCTHDEALFSLFLNRLFNTLSWTMTEFSVSIREMQENHQIGDLQQRKCSVVFDLSCSLARVLEFCTREIPEAFLSGSDMNLRRLTELIVFILNHIISASDSEFFDSSVRRPGQYQEKTNRTMILAPLVGIIVSLMDASVESGQKELNDVLGMFASMDCPATIHCGVQYLLGYNWSNVLREDASLAELAQLEEFSSFLRSRMEAGQREAESSIRVGDEEGENCCCICYACDSDALFEPCHHTSCHGCITRHLLNGQRCFFCNATVTAVMKLESRDCRSKNSRRRIEFKSRSCRIDQEPLVNDAF